jgi:hypothetical protein
MMVLTAFPRGRFVLHIDLPDAIGIISIGESYKWAITEMEGAEKL